MASLKLKVDVVERTALYFNKHEYRAVIQTPNMFYSHHCKTPDKFRERIDAVCKEYDSFGEQIRYWRRPKPEVDLDEFIIISGLIYFKQKYKNTDVVTFRNEGNSCAIYTSDINILNEVASFAPYAACAKVSLMPAGVMVFKRNPPAKYRAYLSNKQMPIDFKTDMLEYLARTPDITPSSSFYTYLQRANYRYATYLWDKYYVDYNDDKNLMMMTLMFPGMIGKTYKLEKKTA